MIENTKVSRKYIKKSTSLINLSINNDDNLVDMDYQRSITQSSQFHSSFINHDNNSSHSSTSSSGSSNSFLSTIGTSNNVIQDTDAYIQHRNYDMNHQQAYEYPGYDERTVNYIINNNNNDYSTSQSGYYPQGFMPYIHYQFHVIPVASRFS